MVAKQRANVRSVPCLYRLTRLAKTHNQEQSQQTWRFRVLIVIGKFMDHEEGRGLDLDRLRLLAGSPRSWIWNDASTTIVIHLATGKDCSVALLSSSSSTYDSG